MDAAKGIEKIKGILGKIKKVLGMVPGVMVNAFDALTGPLYRKRRNAKILSDDPEMSGPEDTGAKIKGFLSGKIEAFEARFLGKFPEEKRKPVLFGLAGLVVLFFILIISVLATHSGKAGKPSARAIAAGPTIPQEELFMPAEPDFLPEFLLERAPRQSWSIEDIRPYWKIPEKTGLWREEIKSAVDKLMEGVP